MALLSTPQSSTHYTEPLLRHWQTGPVSISDTPGYDGVITPYHCRLAMAIMRSMTTTTTLHQSNNQDVSHGNDTHDEIARTAFCIYEKHGSQNGHDVRNWLDAEKHVKAKHASTVHGRSNADKTACHQIR